MAISTHQMAIRFGKRAHEGQAVLRSTATGTELCSDLLVKRNVTNDNIYLYLVELVLDYVAQIIPVGSMKLLEYMKRAHDKLTTPYSTTSALAICSSMPWYSASSKQY